MAAAGLAPAAAAGPAAEAGSNTSSRNGSPTHSTQFAAGSLSQQKQLQAGDGASAAASAGNSFSAGSKGAAGSSGIAAAAMAAAQGVSAVPSSVDVGASQLLSVSALSDLQLPSFVSSLSVADSQHALSHSRASWESSVQQH